MARQDSRSSWLAGANWTKSILSACLVVFVAGGIFAGYLFYSTVKDLVAHAQLGSPVVGSPHPGNASDDAPAKIAQDRTNILILGVDEREGEMGPTRTDTMIVVTVDPLTKSAAMLSIPRDLWVSIPGHSEGRINTAHFLGDSDGYPGGGGALAKTTVQYTLGIPIHFYVRINFEGFEKLVDAIGGITIDVEESIHDERFPDGNYGYMVVDIPAGVQQMDGKTALQYARVRHGGSDFVRARRQQEVIQAIRDKVMKLDIPLTRIPEMLKIAGDSVHTDLGLAQMYELAKLAHAIPMEGIRSGVIDESMTSPQTTPDGAMVLIPNRALIREVVSELFGGPSPTGVAGVSERDAIRQEAATIEVQNGTQAAGLAQRTADYLVGLGYDVVAVSNADRSDYVSSVIIDYSGKTSTVDFLAQRFNVVADNVLRYRGMTSEVDLRLILGRDYAVTAAR